MTGNNASTDQIHDAAVVGTGPSGLVAALALAHLGARVAIVGPAPQASRDGVLETRSAALLASSIDLLKRLGVWPRLASAAAPLKAIRILDTSQSLLRAPDMTFEASELGLDAFGYNIPNTALVEALYGRAQETLPAVIVASVTGVAARTRKSS
jgi:2-octaprenyl-6-methoxyphenol hydroxylase